jgi:uncharacterized protein with FMN-binding domain
VAPEKKRGSNLRVANGLVALSSSAILAVYAAGYFRTRPEAERFTDASPARRAERPGADPTTTGVASSAPIQTTPQRPPTTAAAPRPAPAAVVDGPLSEPADASAPPLAAAPAVAEAPQPTPLVVEAPVEPPPVQPVTPQGQFKDGTYLGWGSCRHGDIQASVVVESGRIASATIAQCRTRYSCSWIDALPGQVVSRQSANVDYVSGATESTDAFADAVNEALAQAK